MDLKIAKWRFYNHLLAMSEIDQAQVVNDTYLPGYLYIAPPSPLHVIGITKDLGTSHSKPWQLRHQYRIQAVQDGMLCLLNIFMNFMLATGPWVSDVTTKEMERPPSKKLTTKQWAQDRPSASTPNKSVSQVYKTSKKHVQ